ncbi:MAG: DUF1826 domain-containing protein [Pseudomonadota bacterium]
MTLALNADIPVGVVGVRITDSAQGLHILKQSECAAVVWQRELDPRVLAWISNLSAAHLPKTRTVLKVASVRAEIDRAFTALGVAVSVERDLFADDVAALAEVFAELTNAPYLRLRLDPVTTNACRKFHVDAMIARLVCTYRGAGTQYGTSRNGADPQHIEAVPTGAPMVMRGTLWPERPLSDLRHRSPPIEGSGETRLLLVLDPVANLEGEESDHK